jgi:hypothetical protein
LKRQRERKKAEKAAQKRAKRAAMKDAPEQLPEADDDLTPAENGDATASEPESESA